MYRHDPTRRPRPRPRGGTADRLARSRVSVVAALVGFAASQVGNLDGPLALLLLLGLLSVVLAVVGLARKEPAWQMAAVAILLSVVGIVIWVV